MSLSSVGLLAIDLAFTLRDQNNNDLKELQKHQTFISILWNVIYWGSLLFGTIFSKIFGKYWQSGHFKMWARIKQVIKSLMILIIGGAVVFGVMIVVVYGMLKVRDISGIKAVALILSNVYNMLVLVLLLAYGLFNLPIVLWKYADNKQTLFSELERAESVRQEYREAVADFYMAVSQCRNMIMNRRTGANSEFMDILDQEMPKQDLDGAVISHSSNFNLDTLKSGQEVTEDFIA